MRETVGLLLKLNRRHSAEYLVNEPFAAMSKFCLARVNVEDVMPVLLTNEEWNRKAR
jgi:hypothetical protein